jgi:DNA sulfur modification protein DndB
MTSIAATMSFPAIKGVQANQVYYTAMWQYDQISQFSVFVEQDEDAFSSIQRKLNSGRIPDIKEYILKNRDSYVFSAITASIDKDVDFKPSAPGSNVGTLTVPMNAKFVVNDGQHRRQAILEALKEDASLATETIPVVFFVNVNTKRCQQMFADLNGKGVKTGKAINTLFDHRSHFANVTRELVRGNEVLKNTTDFQKTSLSKRSKHLFTYSNIAGAVAELLRGNVSTRDLAKDVAMAREFFAELVKIFPDWKNVADDTDVASDVRDRSIATSGVVLHAIGRVGNKLLAENPEDWKPFVSKLSTIDWNRYAPEWEDKVVFDNKISKSTKSIIYAAIFIKQRIGLSLDHEESKLIEEEASES